MSDQQGQTKTRRFFQRTRARIEEFEKTHDDFRSVIEHLDDYKEAYLAGAACLALGFLTGRHNRKPTIIAPVFNNSFTPVFAPAAPAAEKVLDDLEFDVILAGLGEIEGLDPVLFLETLGEVLNKD